MKPTTEQSLRDVADACWEIDLNIAGLSLEIYRNARVVQLCTERLIEIVGDALSRANRRDPDIVAGLESARNFIGLRNRIAKSHDAIEDEIVWTAAEKHVPNLRIQIITFLKLEDSRSESTTLMRGSP